MGMMLHSPADVLISVSESLGTDASNGPFLSLGVFNATRQLTGAFKDSLRRPPRDTLTRRVQIELPTRVPVIVWCELGFTGGTLEGVTKQISAIHVIYITKDKLGRPQ